MQYREDKYGNKISILGYGCMRFTSTAGKIDIPKAQQEIELAIEKGINYFDTAYLYPGNEAALGTILETLGVRDKINIATKLPHYLVKKSEDFDKFFDEELRRLKTDHVDYYLIHMLTDVNAWHRLCGMGLDKWIESKKAAGQIKQIGFSYHGSSDMFCQLVDAYDWEFCQIQYNYQDEHSQAGVKGLKYAAGKGLPVVIMEPLRGGRLSYKLPETARRLFEEYPVKRSPAAWGFRWLWDQPEVTCVLSGMNSLDMIRENVETADESYAGAVNASEEELYKKVVAAINANVKVPCTGCRYCMPCPSGVDIPGCFSAYNNRASGGMYVGFKEYFQCVVLRQKYTGASNCIGCGRCEQHCPQGIKIRQELKNVKKTFENPVMKLVIKITPKIVRY